jgi:hypothetical protein
LQSGLVGLPVDWRPGHLELNLTEERDTPHMLCKSNAVRLMLCA